MVGITNYIEYSCKSVIRIHHLGAGQVLQVSISSIIVLLIQSSAAVTL